MTAHSSAGACVLGYGAVSQHRGSAADAGQASSGARKGVVACLLTTSVAIATMAFVSTPPSGVTGDLAIPSMILPTQVEPSVLLLESAPELVNRMNKASSAPEVQKAHVTALESAPAPKLTAFPHWRYNLFDPKPLYPHHRWTEEKLREEARRLEFLVSEVENWQDQKDKHEEHSAKKEYAWMDDTLSNVSKLESEAAKHVHLVEMGQKEAESRILNATAVTYGLQGGLDYDLDKTKRAVWEIIMTQGKELNWDKLVQEYRDRQAEKDLKEDGEMNYLKMSRYNKETQAQKQRIHSWINGLRGRIEANFTHLHGVSAKLQHLFTNYQSDENRRMQENYATAMHLRKQEGEAVQEDETEQTHIKEAEAVLHDEQQEMKQAIEEVAKFPDNLDSLHTLIDDQHLEEEKQTEAQTEQYEKLRLQLLMLVKSLNTMESAMQQQQESHAALKILDEVKMTKMRQDVENLKLKIQSILHRESVLKTLHDGDQSTLDDAVTRVNNLKLAQDNSLEDEAVIQEQIVALNRSVIALCGMPGMYRTTCDLCPAGFYCQDGLKFKCKSSCPEPLKLERACSAGSKKDSTRCAADRTPAPFFIDWWRGKSSSSNVNEYFFERSDNFGGETRYTGDVGGSGFIEGMRKMPLPGCKWNVHFMVWWPDYDKLKGSTTKSLPPPDPDCTDICPRMKRLACKQCDRCDYHTQCGCKPKECTCGDVDCIFGGAERNNAMYPLQSDGYTQNPYPPSPQEVDDTVTFTINGKVIQVEKPKLPGVSKVMTDVVGDEVYWRFDFKSKTPTVNARPYIVAGQVTILRDGTTGDEGSGMEEGGGFLKGTAMNAIDGSTIMSGSATHDGFKDEALAIETGARLMLFKKGELLSQVNVQKGTYQLSGIAPGEYTCIALCEGMMAFYDDDCQVTNSKGNQMNLVMAPFMVDGQVRVVLTWGPLIQDLDSFMLTPHDAVADAYCEVSSSNPNCLSKSLKIDKDAKGGGPETITILNVRQGRYRYRISEDGGVEDNVERINKSEAQVSVYTSTDVKEFKVGKAGSGFVRGNNWYVFTIEGMTDKIYECTTDTCR